ncbi:GNAT family N-acetyltransferase [Paenibacillus alvei]|uniref:GNAT family N-acetyltransferase n=1 Tax=Paenibacillus alvei TaxID=44250 RepID=UPI003D2940E5
MISLRNVDKGNWEACTQLRVRPEQEGYIASNLYSIAESQFLPGFVTKSIYWEDQLIGFAMYGLDCDDHNYWIYRFMIDEQFQGKGYGKMGLELIVADIANRDDRTDVICIGYHPDNEAARKLYASVGFNEVGIAEWGEMLARYSLV